MTKIAIVQPRTYSAHIDEWFRLQCQAEPPKELLMSFLANFFVEALELEDAPKMRRMLVGILTEKTANILCKDYLSGAEVVTSTRFSPIIFHTILTKRGGPLGVTPERATKMAELAEVTFFHLGHSVSSDKAEVHLAAALFTALEAMSAFTA